MKRSIKPGTVVPSPDLPGAQPDTVGDVGGDAFNALTKQVMASVDALDERVRQGYETLSTQGKDVSAALKSAAMTRAQRADPDLGSQVEKAAAVFKQDQADAKAAEQVLKALREDATTELSALLKLIR